MSGNIQNKLRQVRKPRVHITLDVEAEGRPKKELPFVVGVMGDFGGEPELVVKLRDKDGRPVLDENGRQKESVRKLPSFKERSFVTIDRDNFDTVMDRIVPGLNIRVDNKLAGKDDKEIAVDLAFRTLEDFEPARVAAQVPQLQQLLDVRAKLRDLLSKADRSEQLETLLEQILQHGDELKKVSQDLAASRAKE